RDPDRRPALRLLHGRARDLARMADGLDVVPVGVVDEGAVIVRVVVLADSGSAVVDPVRREGSLVEGVDRRAVGRGEGDVRPGSVGLALDDPERRLAVA